MKKRILAFFISAALVSPVFAGNEPSREGNGKAVQEENSAPLPEKNSSFSSERGTTPAGEESQVQPNSGKGEATAESQKPGRKGFPSFREKPWLYIGSGILMVVIITVYLVFGSAGYSSR
jgi:hypothetical protein